MKNIVYEFSVQLALSTHFDVSKPFPWGHMQCIDMPWATQAPTQLSTTKIKGKAHVVHSLIKQGSGG